MHHTYEGDERREVDPCGNCGARVYLEGVRAAEDMDAPGEPPAAGAAGPSGGADAEQRAKRPKTAQATVDFLKDLQALRDQGTIDEDELKRLKAKAFQEMEADADR